MKLSHAFGVPAAVLLISGAGAVAEQDEVRVFWTDKDDGVIEVADLDGGNRATILSGLADPRGLVVDSANTTIYWASHESSGVIYRMDCDGGNLQPFVTGLSEPADLALDRDNGVLYWAEELANRIRRVDLTTPTMPETVISGLNRPYYIAIDPDGGFLYWSDFNSTIIHRSTIDGDSPGDFITGQSRVRDIELADGMIYWCDRNSSEIRRRAIAGTGAGTILFSGSGDSLDRPHGLVLDPENERMFWTDTDTNEINTAAMDGSGTVTSLATTGLDGAWGIDLSQVVETPYESWLTQFFTPGELDDPAKEASHWGESADPDGDGRLNLLEFAQGTSPVDATVDPGAMQVSIAEESGERSLQLVYRMQKDDPDLSHAVETSVSLMEGSWASGAFTEMPPRAGDPGDAAYEYVTMRSGIIDGTSDILFARLRVSR